MVIECTLPSDLAFNPATRVLMARELMLAMVAIDRIIVRSGRVPELYRSRVRYGTERKESFRDALTVYQLGWGDCTHLACWRLAELIEQWDQGGRHGRAPRLVVKAYPKLEDEHGLVHIYCEHSNGLREDPSAELGMYEVLREQRA